MKTLNLQVIQWCFQLLGNRFPCVKLQQEPPAAATIKLVNSDGLQVKIYDRPIHVSELIKESPNHLVCRSDSLYIGKKIPALSEDDQLQLGHDYFLLPKHCFQSVLSFVTLASFAANSQSQLYRLPTNQQPSSSSSPSLSRASGASDSINMKRALAKKMATCSQPFHIQKTQSGCTRIRLSEEFIISQLIEQGRVKRIETEEDDEDGNKTGRLCTTPQLHKDYAQLVGSRLIWKPELETIRETTMTESEKRKLNFSPSFGMMNTTNIIVKRSSSSSSSSNGHPSSSSTSSKGLISRHETTPKSSKSKSKTKKSKKINIKSRKS